MVKFAFNGKIFNCKKNQLAYQSLLPEHLLYEINYTVFINSRARFSKTFCNIFYGTNA